MQRPMEWVDRLEIASMLEDYHKCFYTFFDFSDVMFSDEIPTACVNFSPTRKPQLNIGEKFWSGQTIREKLFVICHECLHVILDHGVRNGMNVKGATPKLVNIAQDITINEMIVDLFNYDREDIRDWKKYCWIDTCFSGPQLALIKRNETFIYYLEELIKNPPPDASDGGPAIFDIHSTGTPESDEDKKAKEDFAGALAEDLTVKEIEDLLKSIPPDDGKGPLAGAGLIARLKAIIAEKVRKQKINFAHIIRKLKKTSVSMKEKDVDTFTHTDRRFADIITRSDVSLPGKNAVERPNKDRLLTGVFMDVSASCLNYFDVFEKVFLAFDAERKLFDTRLFIFDERVTAVKPGDSVRIGAGTYFNIIETKCRELETEVGRYPDCVVVITDGYGNKVDPKAPSKWVWLLTPKESTSHLIPLKSKKFFINQIIFD